MPVHRAPTAPEGLERTVSVIEATGDIVAVVSDGPGSVLIFTKPRRKETRG